MTKKVSFRELEQLLASLGFQEDPSEENQRVLCHRPSRTIFPFRPYGPNDPVSQVHLVMVRRILDERGLLQADEFDSLLSKAPA